MTLILGGTKSGKTGFAEKLALDLSQDTGAQVLYLATAKAWDEEMKTRIKKHKASRPQNWVTVEYPTEIVNVFPDAVQYDKSIILFDCLTMWITNILMLLGEDFSKEEAESNVLTALDVFLEQAEIYDGELLIISNLVEVGLVSPHFLGRTFQDIAGICHQKIAEKAGCVYQMTAGIPLKIK